MKISRKQLKNLIMETILENDESVLLETPYGESPLADAATFPWETQDHGGSEEQRDPETNKQEMVKRSLFHMSQQAQQLHDLLLGDEELEPWVENKIIKSAKTLEAAFKAITYDKGPGQGRL